MRYNFKIGDIVELDAAEFIKMYNNMPEWDTSKYYKIMSFAGRDDNDGFPIVVLDKSIYLSPGSVSSITTKFLKNNIKKERKEKLQKLNKIQNEI